MQFHSQLYSKQFSWRPKLDGLSFSFNDEDEGSWIERELEESEVY